MIHHVSLGTNDVLRSRKFYDPIMSLLGLRLIKFNDHAAHYGVAEIMLSLVLPINGGAASPGNGVHVALSARTREMVNQFHLLGLANGGTSDGTPGIRTEYDAHYYGAFVLDPDGNKIEAVTHAAK